jgi:hypothetical protein
VIAVRCLPQVEDEIERFVDAQVVKIEDKKWGNKLSTVRPRCCRVQVLVNPDYGSLGAA